MLGYAKLFKEKVRAEAKEEVYNELRQAVKEGKTLEDVLKKHEAGNDNKVSQSASSQSVRSSR